MKKTLLTIGRAFEEGRQPSSDLEYVEVYYEFDPNRWVLCDNAGVVCSALSAEQIEWPEPEYAQTLIDRVREAVLRDDGEPVDPDSVPESVQDEMTALMKTWQGT